MLAAFDDLNDTAQITLIVVLLALAFVLGRALLRALVRRRTQHAVARQPAAPIVVDRYFSTARDMQFTRVAAHVAAASDRMTDLARVQVTAQQQLDATEVALNRMIQEISTVMVVPPRGA